MRKFLKICIIAAAAFALVVVAAGVYLRSKYPPERLKEMGTDLAQKYLDRKIEVGQVSLGLIRGLQLDNIRIFDRAGFGDEEFASIERLRLKPRWLLLLRGQVLVDQLELSGPRVRLARSAGGEWNFSDWLAVKKAPPSSPAGAAAVAVPSKFSMRISDLIVRGGILEVDDSAPIGWNMEMRAISLDVSGFSMDSNFYAKLSAEGAIRKTDASVSLSAGVNLARKRVDLKDLRIKYGGGSFAARGQVERFDDFSAMSLSVNVSADSFGPELLSPWLQKYLPSRLRLAGDASLGLTAEGTLSELSGVLTADLKGLDIIHPNFTKPSGMPFGLKAKLSMQMQTGGPSRMPVLTGINLKEFDIGLKQSSITGSCRVSSLTSPPAAVELDVNMPQLRLEELSPLVPPMRSYKPQGLAAAKISARGKWPAPEMSGSFRLNSCRALMGESDLRVDSAECEFRGKQVEIKKIKASIDDAEFSMAGIYRLGPLPSLSFTGRFAVINMDRIISATPVTKSTASSAGQPPSSGIPGLSAASGKITCSRLVYKKHIAQDVTGQMSLRGTKISVESASAKMYGGTVRGSAGMDFSNPNAPAYNVKLRFDDVNISSAVASMPVAPSGQISGRVSGDMQIAGRGSAMATVSGDGKIDFKELRIEKLKLQEALVKAVQMFTGESREDLGRLSFKQAAGGFSCRKGMLQTESFSTSGGDHMDIDLRGTVDLVANRYDSVTGMMHLNKSLIPVDKLQALLTSGERINVPVKIEGAVDSPSMAIDWNKIFQQKLDKVKENLKEKGKEFLRGIFGKP